MEDTIHDHTVARHFEKRTPVAGAHSVFREMIAESLHITAEIILEPTEPFNHADSVGKRHRLEVFFCLRLQFDSQFHGIGAGSMWTRSP